MGTSAVRPPPGFELIPESLPPPPPGFRLISPAAPVENLNEPGIPSPDLTRPPVPPPGDPQTSADLVRAGFVPALRTMTPEGRAAVQFINPAKEFAPAGARPALPAELGGPPTAAGPTMPSTALQAAPVMPPAAAAVSTVKHPSFGLAELEPLPGGLENVPPAEFREAVGPVVRQGLGLPISTMIPEPPSLAGKAAKRTAEMVGQLTSPESMAATVGFGAAGRLLPAAANLPVVARALRNAPRVAKVAEQAAAGAVPAAIAAQSGRAVYQEGGKVAEGVAEGDPEKIIEHGIPALVGLAITAAAGVGAGRAAARVGETFPTGPPLESRTAVKARTEGLRKGGRRLAAGALEKMAEPEGGPFEPFDVQMPDGRIVSVEQRGPRAFVATEGKTGKTLFAGTPEMVRDQLRAAGATGVKVPLPVELAVPEAEAGQPPVVRRPIVIPSTPSRPAVAAGAPPRPAPAPEAAPAAASAAKAPAGRPEAGVPPTAAPLAAAPEREERPTTIYHQPPEVPERPVVPQATTPEAVTAVRPPEAPTGLPPITTAPPVPQPVEKPVDKTGMEAPSTLPQELAGAKPRYSYGNKQFELQFESDLDKAAYITAQVNRSKRDADYLRFVQARTGLSETEVRSMGMAIRSRIKAMAKDAEPGTLSVPEKAPAAASVPARGVAPKEEAAQAAPSAAPVEIPNAPPAAPPGFAPAPEVSPSRRLMDAVQAHLEGGGKLDNPTFDRMAAEAFGGSRAAGTYDPRDAYDALEAAVNRKMLGKDGKLLWDMEPRAALEHIEELQRRLPTQTTRTQEQIERQQFSTPPALAYVAAKALAPQKDDLVLEPSAGTGSLAVWAKVAGAQVETNEIAPRRAVLLGELGFAPRGVDAEQLNNLLSQHIRPTAILMNPPFSATGGRVAQHKSEFGLRHVQQALARLAPGGRLVAILGGGQGLGRPAVADFWRDVEGKYNVRADVGISGENYRKYGTTFGNRLIVIDKTGPTDRLSNIVRGDFKSLPEVYDAIAPIAADRAAIGAVEPRPSAQGQQPGGVVAPGPRGGGVSPREPERPLAPAGPNLRPGGRGVRGGEPVPAARAGETPAEGASSVRAPQPGVGPRQAGEGEGAERPGDVSVRGGGVEAVGELPAVKPEAEEDQPDTSFVPYKSVLAGKHPAHPGNIVETAPMSSASAPALRYDLSLPQEYLRNPTGKPNPTMAPSDLQIEAVRLANQRFEQRLPGGERAGFFIGDGTGVGKGLTVALTIAEYWQKGGRKILWASAGPRLIVDAQRDIEDAGLKAKIPMKMINDYPAAGEIKLPQGIIFSAYASLASMSKKAGRRRVDQLKTWLGDDPLLIFDESHMAKNVLDDNGVIGKEGSEQGKAVVGLQREIPGARVLYVSATGATEVGNLAYLTRLGFWGPGTSFPGGFVQFHNEIAAAGIGAMETIARDMKSAGAYVSRHLSFGPPHAGAKPVEYVETHHQITPEQERIYNAAADVWQEILKNVGQAIGLTNAGNRQKARVMSQFWAAEQRFFKQLITSFKVPTIIQQTEDALRNQQAVVISLISTNEARAEDQITKAAETGADLDDLEFSPIETVAQFIENVFPIHQFVEETDAEGNTNLVVLKDADGNPVINQEALERKQAILDKLSSVHMPQGVLDQLVNHFGPDKVAEMTGRKRRLLRDPDTGKLEYKARNPHGVAMKDVNVWENKQFQSGDKPIGIISGAAGTGISLHASRREKNQRRRRHIVAELGWQADRTIQSFGRTHRSDEESAPIYDLISTNIAGEKRFSSTIAKRLESLGALSRGERTSTGAGELAKYNFESDYGRAALQALYNGAVRGEDISGVADTKQLLRDMAILKTDRDGREYISDQDRHNLSRFLNRILALRVNDQNALFDHFASLFDRAVTAAKENGTFDEGVTDVKAQSIKLLGQNLIRKDPTSGAETRHFQLELERPNHPTAWKEVERMLSEARGQFYTNRRSGNPVFARTLPPKTEETTGRLTEYFALYRPQSSETERLTAEDLAARFDPVSPGTVKSIWDEKHEAAPKVRKSELHVVGGMITPLWQRLRTSQQVGLKIVRLRTTDTGQRIVGAEIPTSQIGTVLQNLGLAKEATSAADVWREVFDRGGQVPLVENINLKRSKLAGEPAIEFETTDHYKFGELRKMGLINERIQYRERFFVPTDEEKGLPILKALLDRWPVLKRVVKEQAGELRPRRFVDLFTKPSAALKRLIGAEDAPSNDYSWVKRAQNAFFGGLQQTMAFKPTVHAAAVRMAGSREQTNVIFRRVMPQIAEYYPKLDEFFRPLAQSNLYGVKERWEQMAEGVDAANFSDFAEAFRNEAYTNLLEALEGRFGPDEDVLATAQSLFAAERIGELKDYLAQTFRNAAERVTELMPADEFKTAISEPRFDKALAIYREHIEKPLAEAHSRNEGVFRDAAFLGPLKTYYPLMARGEEGEPAHPAPREKVPYKAPRNPANYFATGLSPSYTTDRESFQNYVFRIFRTDNKAALINVMRDEGLLKRQRPGQAPPESIQVGAMTFKASTLYHERTIAKDGKPQRVVEVFTVAEFVRGELHELLEAESWKGRDNVVKALLSKLTGYAIYGLLEPSIHSLNLMGGLIIGAPFIGESIATKVIGNTPVTKMFTAVLSIARMAATEPEANLIRDLEEMAQFAGTHPRSGTVTFSKKYAEMTGAKRQFSLAPLLFGPRGVDTLVRVYLYRMSKQMGFKMPSEQYDFLSRLGEYHAELEGSVAKLVKHQLGLSPFYTAGIVFNRMGLQAWTGGGAFPREAGTGEKAKLRLLRLFTAGAAGTLAIWAIAYRAYTGKWPLEDKNSRFGQIPLSEKDAKSRLARTLFGEAHGKKMIGMRFFSPMPFRGSRLLGIRGAYDAWRAGGKPWQIAQAAEIDILNSLAHPMTSSPVPRAALIALTGKEAYLTGLTDRITGAPTVQLKGAVPKGTKPGLERAYVQVREGLLSVNGFVRNIAGAAGFGAKATESRNQGNQWMRAFLDLVFPGLIGGTYNPALARRSTALEAKAAERYGRRGPRPMASAKPAAPPGPAPVMPVTRPVPTGPVMGEPPAVR